MNVTHCFDKYYKCYIKFFFYIYLCISKQGSSVQECLLWGNSPMGNHHQPSPSIPQNMVSHQSFASLITPNSKDEVLRFLKTNSYLILKNYLLQLVWKPLMYQQSKLAHKHLFPVLISFIHLLRVLTCLGESPSATQFQICTRWESQKFRKSWWS